MDTSNLVIRLATAEDLSAILDLYQELGTAYGHHPDQGVVDDRELRQQVAADTGGYDGGLDRSDQCLAIAVGYGMWLRKRTRTILPS